MSKFDIVFINTRLTRDSLKFVLLDEQNKSHVRRWNSIMNSKYWCWIIDLVVMLKISNLISILIAFVKEKRRIANDHLNISENKHRRERNSTWMNNWYVNIHDSLTCWVRNEHDLMNIKKLMKKKMRCKSQWQNKHDSWRRDFVWIQEKENRIQNNTSNHFQDKIINQLQTILTIVNSKRVDVNDKSIKYCDVLLSLLKSRNDEVFNEINEMIELRAWKQKSSNNLRFFDCHRFFDVSVVIKSVHVMSNEKNDYYVNNYSNWDTYNIVYDEDFLRNDNRRIEFYKENNS